MLDVPACAMADPEASCTLEVEEEGVIVEIEEVPVEEDAIVVEDVEGLEHDELAKVGVAEATPKEELAITVSQPSMC